MCACVGEVAFLRTSSEHTGQSHSELSSTHSSAAEITADMEEAQSEPGFVWVLEE